MLNIEPQIEKIVLHFYKKIQYRATNRKDSFTFLQENTINEMVQTIPHRFNPHVKHLSLSASVINTHYHNSNLIWRTVSRRVDEVIPSNHPRRVASRVIQWYGLIHET